MARRSKQTTVTGLPKTASVQDINKIHRDLQNGFEDSLADQVSIFTNVDYRDRSDTWKSRIPNSELEFHMWNNTPIWAERKGGRSRCPVVPIKMEQRDFTNDMPFVSWHETWKAHQGQTFELKDASLTFFLGSAARINEQLFRAEWDQPTHGSVISAHPHWHIDWLVTSDEADVSGIHLGMAGWNCASTVPQCWQTTINEWSDLSTWATRTLAYARNEILNYLL